MVTINSKKTIEEDIYQLESSVNECSESVIDSAINLGKHFSDLGVEDLEKIFGLTRQFYKDCTCKKKKKT